MHNAGSTQSRQRQAGAVILDGVYDAFEDHLVAPRGRGRLGDAPHAGVAGGAPCGDLIRIAVALDGDGRIEDAGFEASGCGAAQAAASATVELIAGTPLLAAARLTGQDVAAELGGLSPGKFHAATLAADALHTALGRAARDPAVLALADDESRTLVAMSGGVDSAVAALIAQREGHDVVAVTLELWADPQGDGARSCCSPQAVAGARALAHSLGLPHITLDLRDDFEREVVDDFVAEHAAGRTPNPCVRCNGLVRFDAMLGLAGRLGAARLATGHYARVARDEHGPLVRAATDAHKDQSYMLARLAPELLERLWFPLGEATDKAAVRALAAEAGLAVAKKPESQDLCFLSGIDALDLLARRGVAAAPGELRDSAGRRLGDHDGQHAFTVGQRRGLGVAAAEPLYVLRKEPGTRTVTVGSRAELATTRVVVRNATLHRDAGEVHAVKLRYRSSPIACRATPTSAPGGLELELAEPFDGAAPGQTACLLRGDAVVGWGVIADGSATVPVPLPLAAAPNV
ncbi:MAG: tRNA-uridine 2-sulfurtransferase [Thermoleophilaceae bacterium]|nr:tRNA-uridine 2-sulfurtransferase [Thermoleophilaceae bacterium]